MPLLRILPNGNFVSSYRIAKSWVVYFLRLPRLRVAFYLSFPWCLPAARSRLKRLVVLNSLVVFLSGGGTPPIGIVLLHVKKFYRGRLVIGFFSYGCVGLCV